jgi:exopolysaccharide biosynthesis predicted pyruvyltransferase EpsI
MTPYRPLLGADAVSPLFLPLAGRKVGLVHARGTGNVGDRMIEAATEQLLNHFRVRWSPVEPEEPGDSETLLLFGGGSYGHPYCAPERDRRCAALATGLPCVLLPQTVYGVEIHPRPFAAAYVRDAVSARLLRGSRVAPDVTLYYTPPGDVPDPEEETCLSLSSLPEGLFRSHGPDLRERFSDPGEYLRHVARHRRVITDSLHVAVCGLLARRHVTILPTALHKNRSIWESWLFSLGCRWAESPSDARAADE